MRSSNIGTADDDLETERISRYDENPLLMLGYGVNSYFGIMIRLGCILSIFSILFVPVMWKFASQTEPLPGI